MTAFLLFNIAEPNSIKAKEGDRAIAIDKDNETVILVMLNGQWHDEGSVIYDGGKPIDPKKICLPFLSKLEV